MATLSPQFDICYALADLTSPSPLWRGAHPAWRKAPWLAAARRFGHAFWLALPDTLGDRRPAATFDELFTALREVPAEVARRRMIDGLFHSGAGARPKSPRKREWLAFIGLDSDAPDNATESALAREASGVMAAAIAVLEQFRAEFEPIWDAHLPQLERSLDTVRAMIATASFGEVAARLKLKIHVDQARGRLAALRGGYEIAMADIGTTYLLPSIVNAAGFCTVADERLPAVAFFPFVERSDVAAEFGEPPVDPWLVCRALGEPTRAAIVRRLSCTPLTSAELMRRLGLSKANISHHIFQLREAGLIEESQEGRAVRLSLRRETLSQLSGAFRRELANLPARRRR